MAGPVFGDLGVSLFVAGAAFRDLGVALFVAGAVFGDLGVSFFVAGAVFGEIWVDGRSAKCCNFQYKMRLRSANSKPGRTGGCEMTSSWSDHGRIMSMEALSVTLKLLCHLQKKTAGKQKHKPNTKPAASVREEGETRGTQVKG